MEIINWTVKENNKPWFDHEDAIERIQSELNDGKLTQSEFELLEQWIKDGYVVLDEIIPLEQINRMESDLTDYLTGTRVCKDLMLLGIQDNNGRSSAMSQADFIKYDSKTRLQKMQNSHWRIHGFNKLSEAAREILLNQKLVDITSMIFKADAYARSTINFRYGSRSTLHQDMAVFHVYPENYLIGAWIACEDIHPDSGPLVFYPGSHKEPRWEGFNNYPQTALRTANDKQTDSYNKHIRLLKNKYSKKQFIAKKGQVLLWHGMLIHGGDEVVDKTRTRCSNVIHYMTPGVDQVEKINGPFRW